MFAFDKVFAALVALAPQDRVELSRLLRNPRGLFPLVPAEIGRLPWPGDHPRQRAVTNVLDRAIRLAIDQDLAGWTLGQIVPSITQLDGGIHTSADATNRLVAVAQAHGTAAWSDLAPCRVEQIARWRGMGRTLTAQVVQLAIAGAAGHLARGQTQSGQGTLFDDARTAVPTHDLDLVLDAITDHRARAIFEHLDLRLDDQVPIGASTGATTSLTATVVADLLGLSYERCRQLRTVARTQVAQAMCDRPEITAALGELAQRMGAALPRSDVDRVLADSELGDCQEPSGLLAVWLAGPYRKVPGHPRWLAREPIELVRRTAALLADGGGVHDRRSLLSDLVGLGIAAAWTDAWLSDQPVRTAHGLVVQLTPRPGTMAERALDAVGRAMSVAELMEWMPDSTAALALPAELRRSARFVETALDHWELSDWGGDPSQHLVRVEVAVTESVVAGDEARLPDSFIAILGLTPGTARRLPTRFGPLSIAYDGVLVVRGSVRPVALACGAQPGSMLVFIIDPRQGTAEVEVLASASPTRN